MQDVVIVSEAGPGGTGGVAGAMQTLYDKLEQRAVWVNKSPRGWRMLAGSGVSDLPGVSANSLRLSRSFGSGWLWFVLHDMASKGDFGVPGHVAFQFVSNMVAKFVAQKIQGISKPFVLLQDYQCTLMAQQIRILFPSLGITDATIALFVHTPFPTNVEEEDITVMREIVRGMLGNDVIGFHIREYLDNFLEFILSHIVVRNEMKEHVAGPIIDWPNLSVVNEDGRVTRLVVAPIGLDPQWWAQKASSQNPLPAPVQRKLRGAKQTIFSGDRLEPTKELVARLRAFMRMFREHPEYIGEVLPIQAGANSREGLPTYDLEAHRVDRAWRFLEEEFELPSRERVIAFVGRQPPEVMAQLYRRANVMLVNPWGDGWNLTAEEFVACQDMSDPGVLLLSPGAGSHTRLSIGALNVFPRFLTRMSDTLSLALKMDIEKRRNLMEAMQREVGANTLDHWINCFFGDAVGVFDAAA